MCRGQPMGRHVPPTLGLTHLPSRPVPCSPHNRSRCEVPAERICDGRYLVQVSRLLVAVRKVREVVVVFCSVEWRDWRWFWRTLIPPTRKVITKTGLCFCVTNSAGPPDGRFVFWPNPGRTVVRMRPQRIRIPKMRPVEQSNCYCHPVWTTKHGNAPRRRPVSWRN